MALAILQFVLSALCIVAAGTVLTRCADGIADKTGFGRLLVGSILLAGATSLPELTVGITAARQGWIDLTVGDLLGAGLFNLLTLGLMDLTHHSKGKMFSRLSAAHALSATVSTALVTVAALAIFAGKRGLDFHVFGLGAGTWAILAGYILGVRMIFVDQRLSVAAAKDASAPESSPDRRGLGKIIAGFVAAAAVIVIVAPFLASAAEKIAELSGLGRTFVGTTLVALCTTLPELVATFTALRIGASDLAVGNIFGSNAFNLLLLVPVDLAYPGSLLAAVSETHVITCLAVILISGVAVMGQLYHVEKRRRILEPDAVLVIGLVLAALGLVYLAGQPH